MQNLLNDLKEALEKDENLLIEGKLNKALIEQKALALDKDFLKLILGSNSLKKHFFEDVDGTLVFDKVKFQQFIHNKSFLPDSYTSFKNKIGLTSNGNYLSKSNDVVLAWPHKDCVLEGGQTKEDAKRDEIFWNETLAPTILTASLPPKYSPTGKSMIKMVNKKLKNHQ
ncbi:MAG: site-specific DNA-methyltransferase [Balneolaceae bacterium]|nr:site-specific DNA-methyltransferase [Balneolaceae bacterium]